VPAPIAAAPKPPRATGVDLTLWQYLGGKLAASATSTDSEDEEEEEEEVDELVLNEPHWEYFVKWRGRAYIHCEWLTAAEIEADAPPEGKKRLAVRCFLMSFFQCRGCCGPVGCKCVLLLAPNVTEVSPRDGGRVWACYPRA
jgi:hypothetical protein